MYRQCLGMAQVRKAFSLDPEDFVAADWLQMVEEFATAFDWVHVRV